MFEAFVATDGVLCLAFLNVIMEESERRFIFAVFLDSFKNVIENCCKVCLYSD